MLVDADRVSARLAPWRWAWADENADAIAADWRRRKAERPALFNGRVLMVAELRAADRVVDATFFATDYANLLAWIDSGCPGERVWNGFAMGALRGRDGPFLLGRMAAHTANAGRLYCPCGTPDLSDVTAAGEVDLAGSLTREIAEETGLGPDDYVVDPTWTVIAEGGLLAFMRGVRLHGSAAEVRARILAFLAGQERPELAGIEVVPGPDRLDEAAMPATLPVYLRRAFTAGQAG